MNRKMLSTRSRLNYLFRRLIHYPPRLAYALGLGPLIGRLVLLLTTTGRKSGKARVTPLQYEQIDVVYYVAAAFGPKTDWVRNLQADPRAQVRVLRRQFCARAELMVDPERIAQYLEYRLQRRPRLMRALLPPKPTHQQILQFAQNLVLVALYPPS